MNNMGAVTEAATAFPGNTGQAPEHVAPLAEMLRLNGFSTGFFRQEPRDRGLGGQPLGPDRPLADPLGLRQVLRLHRRRDQPVGADVVRRADQIESPKTANYHFMTDMTGPGDSLDAVREIPDAG